MKLFRQLVGAAFLGAVLAMLPGEAAAQQPPGGPGGGNFDPAQIRQRMIDRYREAFEVKSDDEWKLIQDRIEKIIDIRSEMGRGGMLFGRPGGRRGGDQAGGDARRVRGFGGAPSPEAEALQQAIDSKASSDEIKAKLAKLRDAQKEKEARLDQAQAELRKVLTVRQEASAVLMGLLK